MALPAVVPGRPGGLLGLGHQLGHAAYDTGNVALDAISPPQRELVGTLDDDLDPLVAAMCELRPKDVVNAVLVDEEVGDD